MGNPFDPTRWRAVEGFDFTDITYHRAVDAAGADLPAVRIAFDRPEVRNAFRPRTVDQLYSALDDARQNTKIGVVLITGNATLETAVDSLRLGVADYLTKPVDFARVKIALANVTRALSMRGEIGTLRGELRKLGRFGPMIGASPTRP